MEIHSALTSQRLGRMETQLHSHSDPIHLTQGITGVPQPARAPLTPLLISRSSQTPGAGLAALTAEPVCTEWALSLCPAAHSAGR